MNVFPWLIGGALGAGLAHFLKIKNEQLAQVPKNMISTSTTSVQGYLWQEERLNQEPQQYILHSRLHQQPLAIHSLILSPEKKMPQKMKEEKKSKCQKEIEQIFWQYAAGLLREGKCEKVELIQGPVFRKSTPFKDQNKSVVPGIYSMTVDIDSEGFHRTNQFYEVVICHKERRHYFSAFLINNIQKQFVPLQRIVPLLEVEQKTGLAFNIEGGNLMEVDFEGLNREVQLKQQVSVSQQS